MTRERPRVVLRLGVASPKCDVPPFETSTPELRLWSFGWSEWPSFNRGVFDRDLERILRWYRARGFYSARIERVTFEPPEAAQGASCRGSDCRLELVIWIQEGSPVLVDEVTIVGTDVLAPDLRARVAAANELERGRRFDESEYDASKAAMLEVLRDAAFTRATAEGKVEIDTRAERARVRFLLTPGKPYRVRSVRVTGNGRLSAAPILRAAGITPGDPLGAARLAEALDDIRALGAFSSVTLDQELDDARGVGDVTFRVVPRENDELVVGVGVMSGTTYQTGSGSLDSLPQWDVHLFGRYERRRIFDTLGALHVEVRPRLIFGRAPPEATAPELGIVSSARLTEPGLLEAKTRWSLEGSWDFGPDPFLGFSRSDLSVRVEASRAFLAEHLLVTMALQQDGFIVDDDPQNTTSDGSPTPESYRLSFFEQRLRLDLRDRAARPRRGAYFGLELWESPRAFFSDWTSLRLAPEARVYLPLVFESVLALRFALAAVFIVDADDELDALSQRLGPSSYRLRGGGANSVRGFLPGELGVGRQGGIRRWESLIEWRITLGSSWTPVLFLDLGDVNDGDVFRFDQLNTSVGLGLRYFTFLGPVRLELGFRIPPWQTLAGSSSEESDAGDLPLTGVPGALHLTIGDPF